MGGRTGYGCGLKGNGVLWGLGLVSLGGAMLRYVTLLSASRGATRGTLIFLRLCEFQYESKPCFFPYCVLLPYVAIFLLIVANDV